ncbi:MAG: DedA family protein [Rhizobium sp.]|nr:DedA family protein [Rhizobium sp.]
MFLENIVPPIPSELIMPLAGYRSAQGQMSIIVVILAGTFGSILGILPWYWLGRAVGKNRIIRLALRHGRWLTVTPREIDAAADQLERHGAAAVLWGRLVPTVRTLISIPAGIIEMPFLVFVGYSAIGSLLGTAGLALGGYALGQAYDTISGFVDPVATAVLVGIVVFYVYRVVTFDPKRT